MNCTLSLPGIVCVLDCKRNRINTKAKLLMKKDLSSRTELFSCSGAPTVVLLGDRKLSGKQDPTRKLSNVSEIYVHPGYKPPLQYNDIAIIKLDSPVTLSRGILPACLPNPADRPDRVIGVQASGWGQTGAFGCFIIFDFLKIVMGKMNNN